MLVYSSSFFFEPKRGPQEIIDCVARWMGRRSKGYVDPGLLAKGMRERLRDGSMVESRATLDEHQAPAYPFMFCAQLSHGDDQVSGRRWMTEIGIRQGTADASIECSFLLKTDEVSARVTAPIQVTRPRLVQDLTESCNPSGDTPGLRVKCLDEESAAAFSIEVEREVRRWPIVVISATRDGTYPISAERLRSLLVGIADVVEVRPGADTFRIEEIVGRRYGAWGGAINIIFQARRGRAGTSCETMLYRPQDLANLIGDGKNIESEILAAVTHRTNLPYSWRHISLEVVSQAVLRGQLGRSIQRAKQGEESAEYVALLEEADKELRAKDDEVVGLRLELEEREIELRKLQADIDGLKYALSGRQSAAEASDEELSALSPLRDAVSALVSNEPSLEQSLTIISTLFPERVVVLDTAYDSAQVSSGFRYGKKAFDLLWGLVTNYWSALASGQGDMHAKNVFGSNGYAANESEILSKPGQARRTFAYRGRDIEMYKHLKIGVKDSAAETLRIHFEWLADEKRIVIGHCGKHLDF